MHNVPDPHVHCPHVHAEYAQHLGEPRVAFAQQVDNVRRTFSVFHFFTFDI